MMQARKVGQQSMFIAPPQLRLKDSPKSTSEERRRKNLWVMDNKFKKHIGIKIPYDRNMFFTPTK
jgi:hypothetical protein